MLTVKQLKQEISVALDILDHTSGEFDCVSSYRSSINVRFEIASDVDECGWLVLLDLYKHIGLERVAITSACSASMRPPSTAIRHISKLVDDGYVIREKDSMDHRRVYLVLTAKGREVVERWMDGMRADAKRRHRSALIFPKSAVSSSVSSRPDQIR